MSLFQMTVWWRALILLCCILNCVESSAPSPVLQGNKYNNFFRLTRSTRTRVQQLQKKYVSTENYPLLSWLACLLLWVMCTSSISFPWLQIFNRCCVYFNRRSSNWETLSIFPNCTEAESWRTCRHFLQISTAGWSWRLVSAWVFQNSSRKNHSLVFILRKHILKVFR